MRTNCRLTAALTLCSGFLVAAAQAQQAPPIAQKVLPIPWLIPSFVHHPPDDSVVFGSLLEAAGYAIGSNSDWVDVAAGNFCGGSEKELVLLKNAHSNFAILRGPAPFAVATGDLNSSSSHPWRGVAAGNLDGDTYDKIVALRKVTTSGVPDLVVVKASNPSCDVSTLVATKTIGTPSNSEWVDVAVGDFDGTGRKQIALLKASHSNFSFVKLTPTGELNVFHESDLDSSPTQPWKALAAGDIDGDGIDELIAARQASDGQSATVLVYKWNGSGFTLFATSTFGNNGNSDWSSAAVGDFNGDGRNAIVLVKNRHSNFVVLDFPVGGTQLRVLSTADLDSVEGQDWRGLTATNWLSGDDHSASELIAVRAAHGDYRTNLFIYGDPFYRIDRDTALDGTKAVWDQPKTISTDDLKARLVETHTNTVNWLLSAPGDYPKLVEFLAATRGFFVDGRQVRVWVSLAGPTGVCTSLPNPANGECSHPISTDPNDGFFCSLPEESPLTPWSEADFFKSGLGIGSCEDYLGWASLIGRLAQDYRQQVVAAYIDELPSNLSIRQSSSPFTEDYIAELQSRMRSQAPWLNFVPGVYYSYFFRDTPPLPDIARTFDTMLFWFRNEKQGEGPCSSCTDHSGTGGCLDGMCAEQTLANAPGEFTEMSELLPTGRKLQASVYFVRHSFYGEPSARYDFDLVSLILNFPWLGGATAYSAEPYLHLPDANKPNGGCTEFELPGRGQKILHPHESIRTKAVVRPIRSDERVRLSPYRGGSGRHLQP